MRDPVLLEDEGAGGGGYDVSTRIQQMLRISADLFCAGNRMGDFPCGDALKRWATDYTDPGGSSQIRWTTDCTDQSGSLRIFFVLGIGWHEQCFVRE